RRSKRLWGSPGERGTAPERLIGAILAGSVRPRRTPGGRTRSAFAERLLHRLQDRALREVVEAEVPPPEPVGQIEAGIERVAAEERLAPGTTDPWQLHMLGVVAGGVDHQRADSLCLDLRGDALCFHQRLLAEE